MNQPKKNLAESILARAELYQRGLMFEGVPSLASAQLEMPQQPALPSPVGAPAADSAGQPGAAAPPVPGATDALVAGAVDGQTPLQTILAP